MATQTGRDVEQQGPVVALDRHADGRIWVITINRPHRMNALGDGMGAALTEAFEAFRDDATARVAILLFSSSSMW